MRDLNYQLKQLCYNNPDGSYNTQADRQRLLNLIANQLHEMGYRGMTVRSLKPKHVDALVERWLAGNLSSGTIKNRMNCLRWWAAKVNRANVVARHNVHYGIPDRQFVTNDSKAQRLTAEGLAQVKDLHVRMSLELQQAFGLRREEAIKFRPDYADQGDHLQLKPSWTKGGKARTIPIRHQYQREVLERAHRLAGKGSLIPRHCNYRQQLRIYERHTAAAGFSKLHGLRHHYAQQRYEELTGWQAPAAGGPSHKSLAPEQKIKDREARLTVSKELGHNREAVTGIYLSK